MKSFLYLIFLTLFIYNVSSASVSPTRLLFWNLRTFGKGRATEAHGIELASIVSSYDILLFAEIKDSDCESNQFCSIKEFFEKFLPNYHLYLSPSLYYDTPFKKSGSEQYAILTKKNISVQTIEYQDHESTFIRRPFGIQLTNGVKVLVFHSHPNSETELVSLSKVFRYFGNQKTILLGDLNTGCHYVSFDTLDQNDIRKDYDWLIPETTLTNADQTCPYDRILSTKDISHSCQQGYVLNQNKEAKRIDSDHYPIGIECNLFPKSIRMNNPNKNIWNKRLIFDCFVLLFLIICLPFLAHFY